MENNTTAPSRASKTFAGALVPVLLIFVSLIALRGPAQAWSVGILVVVVAGMATVAGVFYRTDGR